MTQVFRLLKGGLYLLAALLGAALAASLCVVVLGISIDLDRIRPAVEGAVSAALDRRVEIRGSIRLTPTLRPILEISGVRIHNPPGWKSPLLASMDLARVQVGIPALLQRRIDVGEITCTGVRLNLESNAQGRNNWSLAQTGDRTGTRKNTPTQAEQAGPGPGASFLDIRLAALDRLDLRDIALSYHDARLGRDLELVLAELSGTARQGQPLILRGQGRIQQEGYAFRIKGGPLEEMRLRHRVYPLSIEGKALGSPFRASGGLGRDSGGPRLDLEASVSSVDIGSLLARLGVARALDMRVEEMGLHLALRGTSLHDILSASSMEFTLKQGTWVLHGAGQGKGLPIAIQGGRLEARPGSPVALDIKGQVGPTPVDLRITGASLLDYFSAPKALPLAISASLAGTRLDFEGSLALPLDRQDLRLAMTVQGDRLDSLDGLLGLALPPWGPYRLHAGLAMDARGYELSRLELNLGESRLSGSMGLDMSAERPRARVELRAALVQLDDFGVGDWSPEGGAGNDTTREEGKDRPLEKPDDRKDTAGGQALPLLSRRSLGRADAQVDIELERVMSGRDLLGSGRLHATLQDARLELDPLELRLADGGPARLRAAYVPDEAGARVRIEAQVEDLDLGIVFRRIEPGTDMGGTLKLDLALDAKTPTLRDLLAHGSGHFDLSFVPRNLRAGIIDLWAVNLLSALASEVDGEEDSQVNCLVAAFALEDGVMQDRVIFMDTSRMSVEGEAHIDFRGQDLRLKATPHAKRLEFFSLATPVVVSGSFDDFGLRINKLRLTTTVASFVTSPVHVPLRRLFGREIPADGQQACRQAWKMRVPPEDSSTTAPDTASPDSHAP